MNFSFWNFVFGFSSGLLTLMILAAVYAKGPNCHGEFCECCCKCTCKKEGDQC